MFLVDSLSALGPDAQTIRDKVTGTHARRTPTYDRRWIAGALLISLWLGVSTLLD